MDLPLLQPVVQEEAQVQALLEAAVLYGSGEVGSAARVALAAQRKTFAQRTRDQLGALWEIARPFSFTASTVPVAAGGALAAVAGAFDAGLFLAPLVGAVALHVGTNVTNEIYDVRKGVDTIVSPRASHAIVKGRITDRAAYRFAIAAFLVAVLVGLYLVSVRGWPIVALGIVGLIGGYTYTAPPFQYKFGPVGIPLVFLLMGPLMVVGSFYAISGRFDLSAVAASIPVALVVGAYLALSAAVVAGLLPTWTLLAMLSLPLLVRQIRSSELGATGQQRAIAMIDLETAQLHAAFGFLLVAGLVLAALLTR